MSNEGGAGRAILDLLLATRKNKKKARIVGARAVASRRNSVWRWRWLKVDGCSGKVLY
ncbi:Hypothetical predicted protein [Podarcis lilfordi]|uniref:Uncharacterized protein n=1 Tax=Podarcis lilfordi TaxID=74358 RepID=A0AA35P7P6_9SAUR|nr:Hypothetical predicted protein [Podarcis lilfordi]